MIRLLLDEHISPSLVPKLGEKGVYAEAVAHIGLSGAPDERLHPGLIVLRESGLTREEQWDRIRPVIHHALKSSDDDFLLNRLVEISAPDEWEIREIPKP